MDKKLHVAVIFGGRSGEHEVSLMSARSVLSVLGVNKYKVTQIGITHEGVWLTGENVLEKFETNKMDGLLPVIVSPDPSEKGIYYLEGISGLRKWSDVDVFFPVLHGTFGEDGTIQGLFELADVAYVGAGVVGSSVGMDKAIFKEVMRANNIPVVESVLVLRSEIEKDIHAVIEKAEKMSSDTYPLFAKPANLGSSVGVTKCRNRSDMQEGLMEAASFDRRVLIERGVGNAREIEVSVLGNDEPVASQPGEISYAAEWYDYATKYTEGQARVIVPAAVTPEVAARLRELAVAAFRAVDCAGMARVDFFLEGDRPLVNEINTIPGFTSTSAYARLWEASGLDYDALIERLLQLALERANDKRAPR